MQALRSIETLQYNWPVRHGGTTINDGAILMPGVTAETNDGVLIVGSSTGPDVSGVLCGSLLSTVSDTVVTGGVWNLKTVSPVFNGVVVRSEYDQSDTMAVASYSAPTVTVTSLEDNIDTGWIYVVSGTGAGQLGFLDTSSSGSCTVRSSFTTALDNTSVLIKILPLFHQIAKLNTAADKIGTDAAAGSWTIAVLQNWITNNATNPFQVLNPTIHHNAQNLNATGLATRFYCDLGVRNTLINTID